MRKSKLYWKEKDRKYYEANKKEIIARITRYQIRTKRTAADIARRMRVDVINRYGGKCVNCGFGDIRALCIDHVNGDGAKEKRLLNNYSRLRRMWHGPKSKKYQILCCNCNTIKTHTNKENTGRRRY